VVAARLRRRGHSPHRPTASITRAIALDSRGTSLCPRPPGCRNLRSRRLPSLCTGCYLCRPSENRADLGGGRLGELVCVSAGLVGDVRVRPRSWCAFPLVWWETSASGPGLGVRLRWFGGRRTRPAQSRCAFPPVWRKTYAVQPVPMCVCAGLAGNDRRGRSPREAWSSVAAWLAADNAWVPSPGTQHAEILGELLISQDLRGNLVTDAHLAALAMEHGVRVCSFDSDFDRSPA
jgi:PIN domain